MYSIISYFIEIIQHQNQVIRWLILFIARFIPIGQWAYDDVHSPKYQKFKTDKLPIIQQFQKQDWKFLIEYYKWRYKKTIKPVKHRSNHSVPKDATCPLCGAPHEYIYDNSGGRGQLKCKVCLQTFSSGKFVKKPLKLRCPYCNHSLSPVKNRRFFTIHKCVNDRCSYYLKNLQSVDRETIKKGEKYKHKLRYLYREFSVDFFSMDLDSLPQNASSLIFRKHSPHIMSLCLTFHVNLGLPLRKTAQALEDLYGIQISHTMVANYCKTAAVLVKPFVDHFDYPKSNTFTADETYIKVKGQKGYLWFIMDAFTRSIIGYQVADNRTVGPCILAMRMAFRKMIHLPKRFKFIADGYSAYPLAAQQFRLKEDHPLDFQITQVIGLTNDDAVSKEFRPFKQMIERLNRTFKVTYRCTCGYDNFDGANYAISLWVAYYNFLRKHSAVGYKTLNELDAFQNADNMPAKWQVLIRLGQEKILELQNAQYASDCCS